MDIICRVLLLALLTQACFGVRVTLEGGGTGTVPKTQEQGTAVTLSCSGSPTSSGGESPKLEWLYDTSPNSAGTHLVYDGLVLQPESSPRISVQNPYSLVIKDLVSSDSGFYTCRIVIPGDVPSVDDAKYNFTVLVPPYQQVSCGFPGDLMLTLGQSASFRCQEVVAQAVPSPTYTWYKNDLELPISSAGLVQYKNSSFTYSKTTGVLTFASVTSGDAGTYYCKAENSVGQATCTAAKISTKEANVGVIVGIVFGVIFALLLIGVLIWWTWRKGYCDGFFDGGKDHDDDTPDDGANDIMLDGAGPLVTKEPSEWSNGTSNKNSMRSSGPHMPEGAVRVMP